MRLWTLHPRYLDAQGLVALWRETLLAREVLRGRTEGYRQHPQVQRFRSCPSPRTAINRYLAPVYAEAHSRGYAFDRARLGRIGIEQRILVTDGQLQYEWRWLLSKLRRRSPLFYRRHLEVSHPSAHPLFHVVPGPIAEWERVRAAAPFALRKARLGDATTLERLIAESVHGLSRQDYTDTQIAAALGTAFGLDRELIRDGTYFVVEAADEIVGCGGWSRRTTLFGGDHQPDRRSELLDPTRDSARIRAFFVRPDWARQGIGRALIERCEAEALAHGFGSTELMATLPGYRLYRAFGYSGDARIEHRLPGDVAIEFIPMKKALT